MSKTIAALLICKNEEDLIGRALESVKKFDSTWILDTGSVDSTVSIVRKYTDNVFLDFVWVDDFQLAQNHLLSKIRGKSDYILSIDADEFLNCDFDEVRKAVEIAEANLEAFRAQADPNMKPEEKKYIELQMSVISVTMLAEGSVPNTFKFGRLFKNTPDIYWEQPIHKHLSVPGNGQPIGNVSIVYGYSPAHEKDKDRSLRILKETVKKDPNSPRNLYYLGREYFYKQKYWEAIYCLEKSISLDNWAGQMAESYLTIANCYLELCYKHDKSLLDKCADACLRAIKINSNFKEAIQFMATISSPENKSQWGVIARTANNRDLVWNRVPVDKTIRTILVSPHQDDEILFTAFTCMREKPLIISVTESFIQPLRGELGCDAQTRKEETIKATEILGCPVMFLGIPDNALNEEILKQRLKFVSELMIDKIYIPAYHENGNPQHNLINKVCMELFDRDRIEQYCSYSRTDLMIKGKYEIVPTPAEMELKNKALDCFRSQINLPSMKEHFEFVRNKSEYLI